MSTEAELLDKFFKRVCDWRLNSGNARISVPVGEMRAAAGLITKLRAERDAALLALKPFADAAADLHEKAFDADNLWESPAAMNLTAGHLRVASALFATEEKTNG
jgi:hypothetical protein